MPWFFAAAAFGVLFIYAAPRLTTAKLEAARAEGIAAKKAEKVAAEGTESTTDEAQTELESTSEAIVETGIAGAPPPIDEDDDS
jgi:hypothetical protein